jgi:hypothetical protein
MGDNYMGLLTMSDKELKRCEILTKVKERRLRAYPERVTPQIDRDLGQILISP